MEVKFNLLYILKSFKIVRNKDVKFSMTFKTVYEPVNDNLVKFEPL